MKLRKGKLMKAQSSFFLSMNAVMQNLYLKVLLVSLTIIISLANMKPTNDYLSAAVGKQCSSAVLIL